jgi:hypothetical protein
LRLPPSSHSHCTHPAEKGTKKKKKKIEKETPGGVELLSAMTSWFAMLDVEGRASGQITPPPLCPAPCTPTCEPDGGVKFCRTPVRCLGRVSNAEQRSRRRDEVMPGRDVDRCAIVPSTFAQCGWLTEAHEQITATRLSAARAWPAPSRRGS